MKNVCYTAYIFYMSSTVLDINFDSIYKINNSWRIVKDFELSATAKVLDVIETELLADFRKKLERGPIYRTPFLF